MLPESELERLQAGEAADQSGEAEFDAMTGVRDSWQHSNSPNPANGDTGLLLASNNTFPYQGAGLSTGVGAGVVVGAAGAVGSVPQWGPAMGMGGEVLGKDGGKKRRGPRSERVEDPGNLGGGADGAANGEDGGWRRGRAGANGGMNGWGYPDGVAK